MRPRSIHICPFEFAHLEQLEIRPEFRNEKINRDRIGKILDTPSSMTGTVFVNDVPLAIVGVVVLREGVAEGWSIIGGDISKYKIAFHRFMRGLLEFYCGVLQIRRLTCTVREDFKVAQRWAESLGFEKEGLMRSYGDDKSSYYLYARISS